MAGCTPLIPKVLNNGQGRCRIKDFAISAVMDFFFGHNLAVMDVALQIIIAAV